ncbi:Flagella basal body P-ring formation protein FlgA [Buchnera aphidicola (Eriosoma lanigerum)]|uniref:flagellar basal body P-ring formation chaperone FlgA n=1 Tax=Buchnera aphidicola TaxID=9 RepID=UPI0034644C8B
MFNIFNIIIFFLTCFISSVNSAELLDKNMGSNFNISNALMKLLQKRDPIHSHNMKINIKNLNNIKIICNKPDIVLMSNAPKWGKMHAVIICKNFSQLIQFNLFVYGKYLVSAKHINFGATISFNDIKVIEGQLDQISENVCLNTKQVINNIAMRHIQPNEPILIEMIHKPWLVKLHQRISVIIKGNGFIVMSEGKALSNALMNDTIDVVMDNGKIITGIVGAHGEVVILN